MRDLRSVFLLVLSAVLSGGLGYQARAQEQLDFRRHIAPILSDKCYQCHGNDAATREADLRLDNYDDATVVIVPGEPESSTFIDRIVEEDPDFRMPPVESGKSLTAEEIELLKRWVREGAKYEKHWSFVAPVRPALPATGADAWARNDIDKFVLKKLEEEGLAPAPEADKVTLIRRVTFDLTGLPPTKEEVDAFLADGSPDAYEKLVDRLLESPRFGEHKARYWLDAVRYGDTHGLHLDNYREMWPYRDWVINALNSNKPYDRFITEQLAGDLLKDASLEEQVASGYNRCNITTNEGGSIPEEVYVRNVVDRVNTFGTVFLGMTVGCAQCHDHKFDPISQKEYFQLFAFFNNIDGNEMDGNVKDHAPYVSVPSPSSRQKIEQHEGQIARIDQDVRQRVEKLRPEFAAWLREQDAADGTLVASDPPLDDEHLVAYFPLDDEQGNNTSDTTAKGGVGVVKGAEGWAEGRIGGGFSFSNGQYIELDRKVGNFKTANAFSYGGWIRTPGNVVGAAIARMDDKRSHRGYDLYIENRRVAAHLIALWPQYAIKVVSKHDVLEPNEWHHVYVTYDGSARAPGVHLYVDGKPVELDVIVNSLFAKGRPGSISVNVPLRLGRRSPGAPFSNGQIDDVKLFSRELDPREIAAMARRPRVENILASDANARTAADLEVLFEHFLSEYDPETVDLRAQQVALRREIEEIMKNSPTTLVFRERKKIRPAYLLNRGEYDQPGEKVARETPAFLPPMPDTVPRDRLGLAQWVTDPQHPLTTRVAVNRFWQQYFGVGLVKTAGDFGLQGEPPVHGDLLDWLATEFVASGWDVKHLHRLIVTSATYRQTSKVSPEDYLHDPENRHLARGPRFRLDAEMLRDQALAVSGLLVNQIGGPSVKPPQPEGLWEAVAYSNSNTAHFRPDEGEDIYRRSVYIFWKRTSPPPYLSICDAPSREESSVRRERTNTPLAALLMMNEQQYLQASIHLATRAIEQAESDPQSRARFLYEQVTFKSPSDEQLATLTSAYDDFRAMYQRDPDAAEKLLAQASSQLSESVDTIDMAAWSMVASIVLNLDEVLCKN